MLLAGSVAKNVSAIRIHLKEMIRELVSTAEIILLYLILSKQLNKFYLNNYKNKLCNKT